MQRYRRNGWPTGAAFNARQVACSARAGIFIAIECCLTVCCRSLEKQLNVGPPLHGFFKNLLTLSSVERERERDYTFSSHTGLIKRPTYLKPSVAHTS